MSVTYLAINGEIVQSPSSGGGSGSSGHIIVNNSGTELTNRTNLKTTGGLNATDDSTNDTTEITDVYEEIPWTTWQGYTAAQKAQHPNAIVTDAPDCDGDVEIENFHLAWTNTSPSSAFAGQQVDLDTPTDYEFTRTLFLVGNRIASVDAPKGYGGVVSFAGTSGSGAQNINYCREFNYVSDTKLQFLDGYTQYSATNRNTDNSSIKPLYVYTYKKDLTAKIQAIAHNVSTEASKCMLNENTSVADALKNQPAYSGISNITAEVKNGVLIVDFSNTQGATANSWNSKGVLPAGYRPSRSIYGTATETNGTTALIYVSSAGEIQIRPKTANTGYYGQIVCGV